MRSDLQIALDRLDNYHPDDPIPLDLFATLNELGVLVGADQCAPIYSDLDYSFHGEEEYHDTTGRRRMAAPQ